MGQGTRAHAEQISSVKKGPRITAGAISCAGRVALYVWRGRRVGECATDVTAVDDRLLSPALASVLCAEHRRKYFARGANSRWVTGVTSRATECSYCSAANQTSGCN